MSESMVIGDVAKWRLWLEETYRKLRDTQFSTEPRMINDAERFDFFRGYYVANQPVISRLPDWNFHDWTLNRLKQRVGNEEIQVQINRNSNEDFELNSHLHRGLMRFYDFIEAIENGADNDLYLTAQNGTEDINKRAMSALFSDFNPLPLGVRPPAEAGHIWIGGRTMTPLHHDFSNNLMCQLMGRKLVRMVSPAQVEKLDYRTTVHSHIKWLDDDLIRERKIRVCDATLSPGDSVFLPVGWWHCCLALEPSATVVFTNFGWPNSFNHIL